MKFLFKKILYSLSLCLALFAKGTEEQGYTLHLIADRTQQTQEINQRISQGLREYDKVALEGAYYFRSTIVVNSPNNAIIAGANYEINKSKCLGNDCFVDAIWVDEEYRNNGIGTKIMHEIMQHATNNNCAIIKARPYSYQVNAKKFFEKVGLTAIATIPSPIATSSYETYCMAKALTQNLHVNRFAQDPAYNDAVGFTLENSEGHLVGFDTPWNQEIQKKVDEGYTVIGYTLRNKDGFTLDVDQYKTCNEIADKLYDYNYEKSKIEVESPYTLYAAPSTGEVVAGAHGNIVVRNNERFCVINELWVDKSHRKNKLGTKIMHELIQHAKNKKCQSIRLETRAWQAQGFYEKLGFEIVATTPSSYCDGAKDAFMLKKL